MNQVYFSSEFSNQATVMTAAASYSSADNSKEKHDVFLSFRGEDTRRGFTSHLYEALHEANIQTYIDNKLERGDEIAPALLNAIAESKLSVVIFSKTYASSRWCLDELVHILECRASQFVIPIFYKVDPSDVRKQLGPYGDAFVEHENCFESNKLEAWREALTTAGNISGFESNSKEISTDAKLVKLVVNDVMTKLNRISRIECGMEGLVGIKKHVQNVELLCLDADHVIRTVGIWGMGGIGKTTIADVLFHRFSPKFDSSCFVQNVGERTKTSEGLYQVRDQLLSTLLKEEVHVATPSIGSMLLRQRLSCTKALVVLDDVSDLEQIEFLTGGYGTLFGPGSKIVVTARNKRMLGVGDAMIYKVKELSCDEALDLFHLRALRNLSPSTEYETLSREVVDFAGGNPLAITVLGHVFSHCKSKEDWKGELDKLKKYPDKKIMSALRLSYDALGENEKNIFLDIACCHRGKYVYEVKKILEGSGFLVNAGIRLLTDMSLISVNKDSGILQMHDLIQEMGRKVVEQCDKNPGKRSRLWLPAEVGLVLEKNKGTEAIVCIVMNMDDLSRDLHANAASFENMDNLRLLDIHSQSRNLLKQGFKKVHLPSGFEFLPDAVTYLRWDFYPLPYLPSRLSSEMLVELHMRCSGLKRLWIKNMQIDLGSLKCIDLSWSKDLAEVPPLSGTPNLESINLEECSSLIKLPSSFEHHAKLILLNLKHCSSLKILPQMPHNLEVLDLQGTAIEELPSSIWSLEKLYILGTRSCKELKNLPTSTCTLNSRRSLDLCHCHSLESLADVLLPSELKVLNLSCKNLTSLPVELPVGLRILYLRGCKNLVSLPKLPLFLHALDTEGCTSLETVPSSMRIAPLQGRYQCWTQFMDRYKYWSQVILSQTCDFRNCLKLDQTARSNIMADAQFRIIIHATASLRSSLVPFYVLCPGNEIPKWMQYKSEGCSINIKFSPHWFRQGFLGYALCVVFECHIHMHVGDTSLKPLESGPAILKELTLC